MYIVVKLIVFLLNGRLYSRFNIFLTKRKDATIITINPHPKNTEENIITTKAIENTLTKLTIARNKR